VQEEVFCDEFHLVDLRVYDNCKRVVQGCEHVFNLAADMGGACRLGASAAPASSTEQLRKKVGARAGMGFIQSNHSVIMYNNTMISFNMLEVSRLEGVKRCVRPA